MFDSFRTAQEQARRPIIAWLFTVCVFAVSELCPEWLSWYVRLFGFIVAGVSLLITWQWIYSTHVTDYARYKQDSIRTPASELARAMNGLDSEAIQLLGALHTVKLSVVPGEQPEIMLHGTNMTLTQFAEYLEKCEHYKLISVRDYPDGPKREAAQAFVNYCVVRGWALPAKATQQNEPATWITGWTKHRVRQQFGDLLSEYNEIPRA